MIKTIFFSTSDRMIPLLEKINELTDLKLCVTKVDVKVGREKKIKENEVKQWCIKNNKKYIQIGNFKESNLNKVLAKVEEINPDLGVVVDFSFMIPSEIISIFDNKLVNIHYSLLPKYRGASPIQFAILNGDKNTGITYQIVHTEMDKGNVLMQEECKLSGKENSQELFEQLLCLNISTMSKFINLYEKKNMVETIQRKKFITYTYSPTQSTKTVIFKEDAYTKFNESPDTLERKIRAFYPKPILWSHLKFLTNYKGLELKDSKKENLIVKIHEGKIENDELKILILQIEGKNKMSWKEFVNGYTK